jgi:Mn2+/Fe2+ NRAMP family transporter
MEKAKADSRKLPDPPRGKDRWKWFGPGFLWMVSAAGSGELLFTPRVGSMYGYALIWALLTAVALKWFINREVGRYTVCTGQTVIDGFAAIPGPKNWAVYFILVPQLFVAVASIAGLAGSAGTALILVLPGDVRVWTIGSILASTALVLWGKFKMVEKVATFFAVVLSLAAIVAAISIFPDGRALLKGFIPSIPPKTNYGEILPWLGFMLSGAAGMIWYSYWIQKKGYGAAQHGQTLNPKGHNITAGDKQKLNGWIRHMTLDNTMAVVGTCIITLAFLILGAELLRPEGLVPEEDKVAEVLGKLLGQVWGPVGFWFMIICVFIGFWDTVLSDQDGFGRMFSGGTKILLKPLKLHQRWSDEKFLNRLFVIVLVTVLPIILYLVQREPVGLLKLAGAVEAAHIPVLAGLTLYLNLKKLPKELKPSTGVVIATSFAGFFFAAFAVVYILQVTGIIQTDS